MELSLEEAQGVIENCAGFDDASSGAGAAWAMVKERIRALEAENERLRAVLGEIRDTTADAGTQVLARAALEGSR